jgi:hypothetical protein
VVLAASWVVAQFAGGVNIVPQLEESWGSQHVDRGVEYELDESVVMFAPYEVLPREVKRDSMVVELGPDSLVFETV